MERLNEEWTCKVVSEMHRYRISAKELAYECGFSVPYLSNVLNGVKEYKNENMKEKAKARIFDALKRLTV